MEVLSGYRLLSKEQQGELLGSVAEKIKSLIGAHGGSDIVVLVEYISVMLQSDKHREAIEIELEAFLQDQSRPFVKWLGEQVEALVARKDKDGSTDGAKAGASPSSPGSPRRPVAKGISRSRSPARKPKAAAKPARRPGGIAASLFGRAVRDAQRSIKTADGGATKERPPAERQEQARTKEKESPVPERSKPKLAPRSPAGRSPSDSQSRSRSRGHGYSPQPGETKATLMASPRIRGRAGALAAAVANAAASTAGGIPAGSRSLPPRPRRAQERMPPPPRPAMMHMAPVYPPEGAPLLRWGPPPLPHGGALYHGGPAPGPPPAHAPPRPGPPPPGPPPAAAPAASTSHRRGKARLAPVKQEETEDASRWHFHAPPGAGPPPRELPPALGFPLASFGPMPHQMVVDAPGYPAWTQVASLHPATLTSHPMVAVAAAAAASRAAPPPVASTVFEFQPAPAPAQPAPAPHRVTVSAPPRPRNFVPQKWRVIAAELVVSTSENMESKQVRTLHDGEIVESVGPPFTLTNGVVRLEIRHPSSAAYPNPIGWVTQDGSATGGGKNLEPGPQPVQAAMAPRTSFPQPQKGGGWKGKGSGKKGAGKSASFTNVSWKPP